MFAKVVILETTVMFNRFMSKLNRKRNLLNGKEIMVNNFKAKNNNTFGIVWNHKLAKRFFWGIFVGWGVIGFV